MLLHSSMLGEVIVSFYFTLVHVMASLANLREGCVSGNYYTALQAFKTVLNRKVTGPKKSLEDALCLLREGIAAAVGPGAECTAVATDLADELTTALTAFNQTFDASVLAEMRRIHELVSRLVSNSNRDVSKTIEFRECSARVLEIFLSWACSAKRAEGLSDADREWLHIALATDNLELYRLKLKFPASSESASSHLKRAAQLSVKTISNPSLLSSILGECLDSCGASNRVLRNTFTVLFVAKALSLAESRPSSKLQILSASKQMVCSCRGVSEALAGALRVCFRVVEISALSPEKCKVVSQALDAILINCRLMTTLVPEVENRKKLFGAFMKFFGS